MPLNHGQAPSTIRFSGDGTGHGIRWDFVKKRQATDGQDETTGSDP